MKIGNIKVKENKKEWKNIKGIKITIPDIKYEEQIKYMNEITKAIADAEQKEVRWEYDGVGQGHYIHPSIVEK